MGVNLLGTLTKSCFSAKIKSLINTELNYSTHRDLGFGK